MKGQERMKMGRGWGRGGDGSGWTWEEEEEEEEEEDYFSCRRKSETVGDIDLILAPFCTPSWGIVQRHIQFSSRCKIFTPARAKNVRKKALTSVLSMNLSESTVVLST